MNEAEFRSQDTRGVKSFNEKLNDVHAVAMSPGNSHADHYLRGMANGLELAVAIRDDREPAYIEPGVVVVFDYMAEADKTCSVVFNPQNIDRDDFVNVLRSIAGFCEDLNIYKKLLVRGKLPADLSLSTPTLAASLAVEFDPNNSPKAEVDLLHGLIGAITEAGEMAELLIRRIETGEFDRVNAMEEGGDMLWYLARQLRGMNADFDVMGRMNIDKLHGRHGESFNVFRDANRDLATERKALETAAAPLLSGMAGHDGDGMPIAPEPASYGECEGDNPASPPEPGMTWHGGCWRREIVRDVPGLAV